ncbi:hypothetical protein [Spiroplasma attinicola]|uniref:hypothetical protein n=1 Tax=Spiroplasma attinicola TaxID=2904537 RepID=UPI0020BE4B08|nr:hypothetical protein [Spiroplasma sp. JKS002669]
MMNMTEIIKHNLEIMYKSYHNTFENLSMGGEHNNKPCVKSKEEAISGDRLKEGCNKCKKYEENKSVDAISFNKNKFIFIEFKIKQRQNMKNELHKLSKTLKDKFYYSLKCFRHNLDKDEVWEPRPVEKIFVYKLDDRVRNQRIELKPLKYELKDTNIVIMRSEDFDEKINNYKYNI